jgi:leucyl/phenylalanyl-tRNA--protein transferase
MRQLMKKDQYFVSFNADFEAVIQNCATAQNRNQDQGAWLGPEMIKAYTDLHHEGFAASVEVWDGHGMVGGLYGVIINDLFFGESMFSLVPNASKLALIHFATRFGELGGRLIDCQFETPHLRSMGGRHITYEEYTQITGTLGDLTDVL